MLPPHWNVNAHSIIYITQGNDRFQVVRHSRNLVFDDEEQMIIVQQDNVVLKKVSGKGPEWIAFKTNDNAATSQVAGRLSAIQGMPKEVLMNVYVFSKQDAKNLKYIKDESGVFEAIVAINAAI